MDLLNAGRKFWITAVLLCAYTLMFVFKILSESGYIALTLPTLMAFFGANVTQKFANPTPEPAK